MIKSILLITVGVFMSGCQNSPKEIKSIGIDVQGHRGARSVLPENSLPAFDYALEVGVTTLEMDTVITKDNQVVVYHDLTINPVICRAANGKKPAKDIYVRSLTLEQVKSYDCGSVVNPRFPKQKTIKGTQIPTLDEVFELVKNSKHPAAKNVLFNIEMKSDPRIPKAQPSPAEFAKLVSDIIIKHKMQKRVNLQSFDHRTLIEAHKIAPQIARAALFESRPNDPVKATLEAKSSIFSPYHKWLTEDDVQKLQENGIKVIPWTANTKKEWENLLVLQVDGIVTDDPKALIEYIKKRGL